MGEQELINTRGTVVDPGRVQAFTAEFRGTVIRPGDKAYESARRIWNASIDKRPGIIARCAGVADVIDAVNFARNNNLLLAIRGGGHNVAGRALCEGGVVVDLSQMKGVFVDPKQRVARVQAGATLGDVDRETHVHGLAVPAGVVSKTGIAGLTLGGGVGWLVRKYGLTCDNVLSFELITAEGQLLTVDDEEHPDLFWGLRGGGGNFGVVTSFEYRAYPVHTVLGGMIIHPRERATEVLKFYREFTESAPEELTVYSGLIFNPDGDPVVAIVACYCGDLTRGEEVLRPLREFGTPLMDTIEPIPFPKMQAILDDAFQDGTLNYWKSTFVSELDDEVVQLLVDRAQGMTSPLSAVIIEYYGGAASRVPVTDTAFGHRDAQYDIGIMAQWTDPAESDQHTAWARNLADALQPFSSGAYLLNFLGEESDSVIKAAFGPNYERLVAVKSKYDPTNFFRINQNIPPTAK